MRVVALNVIALWALALSVQCLDQTQIEKYGDKSRKLYLDVPNDRSELESGYPKNQWVDITVNVKDKDEIDIKNSMTDIIHDINGERPRCFGPSCQEGFVENEGPQVDVEHFVEDVSSRSKDFQEYPSDRIQAIKALAAKLKKERLKADRYYGNAAPIDEDPNDDNDNVHTSWNKLNIKQHKHPYDDKDGWISMEPIAWSTSKVSKWKPNIKKPKPVQWNDEDDDRYSNHNDDRYSSYNDDRYSSVYQDLDGISNSPNKKPYNTRPTFVNNKFQVVSSSSDWDTEVPSKPSWERPDAHYTYPSTQSWSSDDGRRPHKHHCDNDNHHHTDHSDDAVIYGLSDSIITDSRPSHFPYEYQALKRPSKRPTQVIYSGLHEPEDERGSRPSQGDGQWILLSTTKGYRNKKRQRSLLSEEIVPSPTMTSHQSIGLTVLPVDDAHTNMTTSHGGLLEVERSFKTVEESKRDMDKQNEHTSDEIMSLSNMKPSVQRVVRKKLVSTAPDTTSILAAVGAGMVPATMAMVVPMMLGRRKKRDLRDQQVYIPYKSYDRWLRNK